MCYCRDCQAVPRHLGSVESLDAQGGSDIFHTIPSRVTIDTGMDRLGCLRLSPKGLLRWYATCCDTPMFNTLAKPNIVFVGLNVTTFTAQKQAIGPIRAVANIGSARTLPEGPVLRKYGVPTVAVRFALRHFGAKLRGDTASLFFGADGAPIVTPIVLTQKQRQDTTL